MVQCSDDTATYRIEEVAKYNGKDDPKTWIIYKDSVYDITEYLAEGEHPGGNELIDEFAGKDFTKAFDDYGHSNDAKKLLKSYKIGEVVEEQRKTKSKKDKKSNTDKKVNKPKTKTDKTVTEDNKENQGTKYFTIEEVAKHNGENDAKTWIIYRDIVYDVTEYLALDEHPGGNGLIEECAGKDATKGFDDYGHSNDAKKQLETYKIGELVQEQRKKNLKKLAKENKETSNEKYQNRSLINIVTCGIIQC